jgi:PII-like signaling protein
VRCERGASKRHDPVLRAASEAGAFVVNEDCLKLTTYFGERDRVAGELVADALLDLYGRARIQTSVLLRGAEGFGLRHRLRTDRLLSLSEDLPVVSVAVDTRARIEAVLGDVAAMQRRGLITLERARLLSGEVGEVALPEELHEATKLTVYFGRHEKVDGRSAFMAICDLLHRRGIAGATALLGVDGTARGERRRGRFFSRNEEVPAMVVAVGSGERIGRVLPELGALPRRPLLTLERVRVCKRDGEPIERPHALPAKDERGMDVWQKLTVYTSESARHGKRPIHSALVHRLRETGAAGATSLRGIWGFHGDHAPHGDRLLQLRRRVPVVTVVVDSPERIASAFEVVDELTAEQGLVTSEMVPALAAIGEAESRGGLRPSRHRF